MDRALAAKELIMSYPTKLVTARIMTEFMGQKALFAIGATELHVNASDDYAREVIADQIGHRMKADQSQRLFQGLTIGEVSAVLLTDRYEWQLFTNPLK